VNNEQQIEALENKGREAIVEESAVTSIISSRNHSDRDANPAILRKTTTPTKPYSID